MIPCAVRYSFGSRIGAGIIGKCGPTLDRVREELGGNSASLGHGHLLH